MPEADAAFVSSERTEWELHGSRTDQFARTVREEPLLGGLREPGNPTRRTQWQDPKPDEAHPPIAQPAPFSLTGRQIASGVIALIIVLSLIVAHASSSTGKSASEPPLSPLEQNMSDGFYTLYGKDFKVIRGTCFVVGALVSCRVENPYGYRFTQEATLSPDGSIDPQSFR